LTNLPALPLTLDSLDCNSNQLTSLPALHDSLTSLLCGSNQLTALPNLPLHLKNLACDDNPLTSLPSLPASLHSLFCFYTSLASLPALPSLLDTLNCSSIQLSRLPNMPSGLKYLDCSGNQLTAMPALPPGIKWLNCSYNPSLSCLPALPSTIMDNLMAATGTNVQCVPNSVYAVFHDATTSLPLCGPSSGCDFHYNISGNVHIDTSISCIADSIVGGIALPYQKVQLIRNGQVQQQTYSLSTGHYSFKEDTLTNYVLSIDTTSGMLAPLCPLSSHYNISLSSTHTSSEGNNFGMQCNGDYRAFYLYGRFRPTFTSRVNVGVGNWAHIIYNTPCGAGMSGKVITIISGAVTYIGPAAGALSPVSVSGDTLIYNITDLNTLALGSLDITVTTNSTASIGSSVCITTIIAPTVSDSRPSDDTVVHCFSIVNSWDPNHKEVTPIATLTNDSWLTYTIEFQNTGSDTAYTVVVKDTLSQNVDPSTFQYLASDHRAVIQLFDRAMVFTFPKINLVDSHTNAQMSTGWIQYKVKSKGNLRGGAQVSNTASIFFDLNAPIMTNTVINTMACTPSHNSISQAICAGDSVQVGRHVYRTAGTYADTLTSPSACDSILTLTLTVTQAGRRLISASVCNGGTYSFGGRSLTRPGSYSDTIHTSGCDSIVTLTLAVTSTLTNSISQSICQGSSYIFGIRTLTQPGIYHDTLTTSMGCDSVVSLSLAVTPLPAKPTITHSGTTLHSSAGVQYQWLLNGNAISGATSVSINITGNGSYSVQVADANGCSNTSDTVLILGLGINDFVGNSAVRLFPNPNRGSFTLQTSGSINKLYTISDMLGHIVAQETIISDQQAINFAGIPDGVYSITVKGAQPLRFVVMK
jgi:uncharacterized repeat protein (TIGR01451 family)